MTLDPDGIMRELADEAPPPPRLWQRTLTITVVMLSVVVLVAVGGLYLVTDRLAGNVDRIPGVFAPLDPADRPAESEGTTFLLAGRDSSVDEGGDAPPGSERADTVMLERLNGTRTEAAVVSIPRDSWVTVPGHGMATIKDAYTYGGPTLLVRTVEDLTDIRIDHFGTIDFAGFESVVDSVGGIDVTVAERTTFGTTVFEAGENHLDGAHALAYVRQRAGLPGGDFDRAHRQQNALRALLRRVSQLEDPPRMYQLMNAVTSSVAVDDTVSDDDLRSFVSDLRGLRPENVTFLTAPVAATGAEGTQTVMYLDTIQGPRLWEAMQNDAVDAYVTQNGGDTLSGNPR